MSVRILQGDCRDVLKTLPDASVDSIVTDPPYELTAARPGGRSELTRGAVMGGFMGMKWDGTGVAFDTAVWLECLRVLKPGGHLLSFGGSRTYHRMACAIEDAGFEIRDQIMWIYGSGFPKSLDVSKAIDKDAGHWRGKAGGVSSSNGAMSGLNYERTEKGDPVTAAAAAWLGWGTALKPAHEPIVVARKPLAKGNTVAANVLAHGTGALNIDGCRVGDEGGCAGAGAGARVYGNGLNGTFAPPVPGLGRWPANLIHDGSEEVLSAFPDAAGQQGDLVGNSKGRKSQGIFGDMAAPRDAVARGDVGSAARFFYCAKASKVDREVGLEGMSTKRGGMVSNTSGQHITRRDDGEPGERANHHPTVKPTELMRYLCRLVTPSGGTVLDPFAGSGSTGRAADIEGFNAILIELDPEYVAIAQKRICGDSPLFADVVDA